MEFFLEVANKEYERIDGKIQCLFAPKNLKKLEIMHYVFILISRNELFAEEYTAFQNKFAALFTFNSNRSEGSKIKREEIEKTMNSRIRIPKTMNDTEIFNSLAALTFSISPDMKWNIKSIKSVHGLLLQNMARILYGSEQNY